MNGRKLAPWICVPVLVAATLGAWLALDNGGAAHATAEAKIVDVDNPAALGRALGSARGGETIRLAPGVYAGLTIRNVSPAAQVIITSIDPAHRAVLTDFTINKSERLSLQNLELATQDHSELVAKGGRGWAFRVTGSRDISFDRVFLHGSLDGDASNDISGLQVLNSENIRIANSEFTQLARALAAGDVQTLKVSGNIAHGLRTDGFDFSQVGNVEIVGNTLHNFSPAAGDHPDAIQFWTTGTTSPSHDILVADNIILRGAGGGTQGIFFRDQLENMRYQRVSIVRNLIVGTGYNAIRVGGVVDLTVSDNHLVSFPGKTNKSFMLINDSDRVTSAGNRAISISYDRVTNLAERDNALNGVVEDAGAKAMRHWIGIHAGAAPRLAPFMSGEETSRRR